MIRSTVEASKYYNALCKRRPGGRPGEEQEIEPEVKGPDEDEIEDVEEGFEQFANAPQAFYCAAVIGHLIQQGDRPEIKGDLRDLLRRAEQWDAYDKEEIREPLTVLAKIHYGVTEPDEILQVVAELAEVGIRQIYQEVREHGQFDFQARIADLRASAKSASS